jgi:GPH family glycoside/pentoside/hexuronide:cation symporter
LAKGLVAGLPEVLRNRSFLSIFMSALLLWIGVGINGALNNHTYVFVWKLPPQKIQFVGYAFYLGILCGIPLARLILQRLEKKSTIMLGLAVFVASLTVIQTARALGLITPAGDAALPWLITNAAIGGLGLGLAAVGYPAMIGDAADEHEVRFDARREGLYFAGLGFATKAAGGFGQMAAGFALDGMHFPKVSGAAAASAVPEHLLKLLVLAWGPLAGLFLFGAALSLIPYSVSRRRHGEIVAAQKVRRANEARSS